MSKKLENHLYKSFGNTNLNCCFICGKKREQHRLYPNQSKCSFCGEINPTDKHLQIHFLEDKIKQIITKNTLTVNSFIDNNGKNTLSKIAKEISEYVYLKLLIQNQ